MSVNTQEVKVGEEADALYMPPPTPCAELAENTQLVKVGKDLWLYMPPPEVAELFVNTQLVKVGEDMLFFMPPPLALAELSENTQLVKVGEER